MKKAILKTVATVTACYMVFFTVAQLNYLNAVKCASQSEGSDQAIETAMHAHGFNIDAMDPREPNAAEKFAALVNVVKF